MPAPDSPAEFAEPRLQPDNARSEIKRRFWIDVVERTYDDIAQALDFRVRVDKSGFLETRVQIRQRALA